MGTSRRWVPVTRRSKNLNNERNVLKIKRFQNKDTDTELLEQDELFGDQQALGTCDKAEQKPKQ